MNTHILLMFWIFLNISPVIAYANMEIIEMEEEVYFLPSYDEMPEFIILPTAKILTSKRKNNETFLSSFSLMKILKNKMNYFLFDVQESYLILKKSEDDEDDNEETQSEQDEDTNSADDDVSSRIEELDKLPIGVLRLIGKDRLIDIALRGTRH